MSPRLMPDAIAIARRQSPTAAASTAISGPVIIGIAVAGAVVLCGILTAAGLYFARVVHQRKKAKFREVEAPQDVGKDIRTVLEMTQPEAWSGRQSIGRANLQGSPSKRRVASTWPKEDSRGGPATARLSKILKRRSLSPEKPAFRISGMRDSWPLVSHMDMPPYVGLPLGGLVNMPAPNNPTATIPNGSPPKWPTRTYSRASRQNLVFETPNTSPEPQPFSKIVETRDSGIERRHSTSESQLTSILRSTSQRLKRNSLTRARSSIGVFPGSPPKERLPSPPRPTEKSTEGREKAMTPIPSSYAGSMDSSIYERYLNRTPSPGRKVPRSAGQPPPKRARSPALSAASEDSLCGGKDTPDLVVPATLTSPSKRGTRNEQRHKVRISAEGAFSGGSSETSALMHKDARSSVSALGNRSSMLLGNRDSLPLTGRNSSTPRGKNSTRVSLQGDPFRSSVQSTSTSQTAGPLPLSRPLYFRKSTFGGQATPERPSSYVSTSSPLRDVSGNEQTPPNKSKLATSPLIPQVETQSNPFQWAPQEAKAHQIIKTSGSRRKAIGHKRSNTRRVSVLPKRRSVDMVLETPEEDSPGRAALKPKPLLPRGEKFIATELADVEIRSAPPSPSRSPNREISLFRPPSIRDFNPSLKISQPAVDEAQESSIEPGGALYLAPGYSSTLAMCNYYDDGSNSEDEFFKNASLIEATSRRRRRDFVGKEEEKSENKPFFTRPRLSNSRIPKLIPPSPSHSPVRPPSINIPPPASPTPSLLSTTQKPQLHGPHGPRKEPPKAGITMETQICMLRRMNSDVSGISSMAGVSPRSETLENSPTLPSIRGRSINRTPSPNKRGEKEPRSRASKHYLNLGSGLPSGVSPSKRRPGMSIRDSMLQSRVSEKIEQEIEKAEEAGNKIQQDDDKYETVYDPTDFFSGGELTPIRVLKQKRLETKSPPGRAKSTTPPKGLNIQSLKYPLLSSAGQSSVIESSPLLPEHDRATRTRVRIQDIGHPNHLSQNATSNSGLRRSPIRRQKTPATDGKRWSDAMVKAPLSGVRNQRESKMEMPTPRTPPRWKNLGISQEDVSESHEGLLEQENGRMSPEKGAATPSRPESLGLYDEEGFLRSSPDRSKMYDHLGFLRSSPERMGMI